MTFIHIFYTIFNLLISSPDVYYSAIISSVVKKIINTSLYYQSIHAIVLKRLKFDFDEHQLDHHLE